MEKAMNDRKTFSSELAKLTLAHVDRAVAFLWYYRNSQEFDERSAGELAKDIHDDGFPKPNVTRLREDLKKSKFTISGKRKQTFQIDLRRIDALDEKYSKLLNVKKYTPTSYIIPKEDVDKTRKYLEKIVHQINSSYELGFYDCCAAMMRRLMESLIIEVYISEKRKDEIQNAGSFFMLDALIHYICSDSAITLSRNSPKTMKAIKQIGDTAAHDRVYITNKQDIDDITSSYRKLIHELLVISKVLN
jgi:hypothetical protein